MILLVRIKTPSFSSSKTGCYSLSVEAHAIIDNIRQTYETELNDLKHIIQLFDNTDPNEHMAEIVRQRKKIDELTANKVFYFHINLYFLF